MEKCPKCGYDLPMSLSDDKDIYRNLYGRICCKCFCFIESDFEPGLVKKNKLIINELRKKAIEKIRRRKGD